MSAQVIPIECQLNRNSIDFKFSSDSISPVITDFVIIQNKSGSIAKFSWNIPPSPFSIQPMSGSIESLKSLTAEITYKPETHPHDEVTMVLNVEGSSPKTLKCIGDVGSPKCQISKKQIPFGLIPLGIEKDQQIRVKNISDDDAIFTISHSNANELTVSPSNGRITGKRNSNV